MSASFIPRLPLKIKQIIGESTPLESIPEEDYITALQFDHSGNYLAIGDKAGRIIIFEYSETEEGNSEYQYFTEFQSHIREYDYLKSTEIEEKILEIHWLSPQYKSLYLITTNEKFIKLWKIGEKTIRSQIPSRKGEIFPKYEVSEVEFKPKLHSQFPNLHSFNINNICITSNEEFLLSSDDFRINLWNIQNVSKAYNVVDINPNSSKEAEEIITTCCVHPKEDSIFAYATSDAIINLVDLRIGGPLSQNNSTVFKESEEKATNFLLNIINSISDVKFSSDATQLISRDFLNVIIWDVREPSKPLSKTCLYEPLKGKLCDLYENDYIFERFSVATSSCSNYIATGSFNSCYHVLDRKGENNVINHVNFEKTMFSTKIPAKFVQPLPNDYSFSKRINRLVFHPEELYLGVAYLNSVFLYSI